MFNGTISVCFYHGKDGYYATMNDPFNVCLYCGSTQEPLTEAQERIFGKSECCGELMHQVDRNRIHELLKGLDALKTTFERELVKGFGCEQYLGKEIK